MPNKKCAGAALQKVAAYSVFPDQYSFRDSLSAVLPACFLIFSSGEKD